MKVTNSQNYECRRPEYTLLPIERACEGGVQHVLTCHSRKKVSLSHEPSVLPLSSCQIYHSFHDEVDVYRQHWWRCNGPCQNRKPYFGYVKRAMNRAPSAQDPWWADHQRTCGGTYSKVKEPEGYGKKGKKDGNKDKKALEKKMSANGKPSSTTTGDEPSTVYSAV